MRSVRSKIDKLRTVREIAIDNMCREESAVEMKQQELSELEVVQELFQKSVKLLYDTLATKLGDIVTEGLQIVFPDDGYRFVIEFVERRSNIEADLYLVDKDGNKYHPSDSIGGGVVDFIGLLLRIMYILLSKYENVLIGDEPLKWIDRTTIEVGAEFVKSICTDFNFQMLVVSHIPEMILIADKVYNVSKTDGVSVVKAVKK